MKIISPCFTSTSNYAKPLIETLNKHSPDFKNNLILYSDGTTSTDFFYTKMQCASELLKTINDDIVILLDAFDVIVNKPLDGLIQKFKNQNCNLLISAEANCFPYKEYEQFLSHKSNTRLKFPCAGAWIGYREYMIELFDSEFSIKNHLMWRQNTDQAFMETIYYKSFFDSKYSVKIDSQAEIFVNTFLLKESEDFIINNEKQMIYLETDNIPYFVHFNGDGKIHMPLFGYSYCK